MRAGDLDANNSLAVRLTYTETGRCPDPDATADVVYSDLRLRYSGTPTPPGSLAAFFPAAASRIDVVVPTVRLDAVAVLDHYGVDKAHEAKREQDHLREVMVLYFVVWAPKMDAEVFLFTAVHVACDGCGALGRKHLADPFAHRMGGMALDVLGTCTAAEALLAVAAFRLGATKLRPCTVDCKVSMRCFLCMGRAPGVVCNVCQT